MPNDIMTLLKHAKQKYAIERFNIVGIFGSYARNEASKESDIDILYELDDKFITSYQGFDAFARLASIKQELKNLFGIDVDIAAKYIMKDLQRV